MLISLSAPSCYWQSSLLQYLLNFFQSPSFPPPPLPVPENSLILFLKMYSLPIAFARSPSPPPRKQKAPSAAAQRIMRADDWWSLPPPLPNAHLIRTVLALACFSFSTSLLFSTPYNALKCRNHFCFSFLWIPLSLAAKGGSACHKAIYYPFRSLNAVLFLDPSILHFPADSFSFFLSSLPAPGKKTDQPTGIKFTQCEVPWKVVRVRPLPVL